MEPFRLSVKTSGMVARQANISIRVYSEFIPGRIICLMILTIKYPEMQKFTAAIIRFMRRSPTKLYLYSLSDAIIFYMMEWKLRNLRAQGIPLSVLYFKT
jgi:hypothetical protein